MIIKPSYSQAAGRTSVGPLEPRANAVMVEHVSALQLHAFPLLPRFNLLILLLANGALGNLINILKPVYL
jgi:hypothetical protein